MNNNMISLDHIALQVTSLEQSIRFYQNILQMEVFGPVNLGTLSASGRFVGKAVSGGQGLLKGIIKGISPRALHDQYTDIALLASSGSKYNILLVQKRYPETGMTKSVDGKTIFGFSCTLSPSVNAEILAWDLAQAEATFQWGDQNYDGTLFTEDNLIHSIYVQDPDGRVIELKPGTEDTFHGSCITSIDSITLHATYPEKSAQYYTKTLGFSITSDSKTTIPGKRFIWLTDSSGRRLILLYGLISPDGTPVQAGGYGLDHFALTGLSTKGEKHSIQTDVRMNPENLIENSGSTYLQDSDGYWIENYPES
jgi:catechol 2,3-dioxygenase-like lactoylglutathione lyase family enzyme